MKLSLACYLVGLSTVLGAPAEQPTTCTDNKPTPSAVCHNDAFFKGFCPQESKAAASRFCSSFLHASTTTKRITSSKIVTKTISVKTTDSTTVEVSLTTSSTTITVTLPETTTTSFETLPTITHSMISRSKVLKRGVPQWPHGIKPALSKSYSSACSCLIHAPHTVTKTVTTSRRSTKDKTVTEHKTSTKTSTSTVATTVETTAAAPIETEASTYNCAPPHLPVTRYGSGSITCPQPTEEGQQAVVLRIEGALDTPFEGCISSGPRDVTTDSGGTHLCDGTNSGAHPNPGATFTSALDEAAKEAGFTYDGTYDTVHGDFQITRIGTSSQTSIEFWGILDNLEFTTAGGCKTETAPNDRVLWAFDVFNKVAFLTTSIDFAIIPTGQTVTVTVTDQNGTPQAGASVGVESTDENGKVVLGPFAVEGCYVFKASKSQYLRSNTVYITVTDNLPMSP